MGAYTDISYNATASALMCGTMASNGDNATAGNNGQASGTLSGVNGGANFSATCGAGCRSTGATLVALGAKVTLCGPRTLVPRAFERMGVSVTHTSTPSCPRRT